MEEKRQRALLKKQRYDQLLNGCPMKISRSKTKGRHILASQDLSAGSVVLKELPVGFSLFKDAMDEYCNLCLKELPETLTAASEESTSFMGPQRSKRGIPCSRCRKQTFYCSQECHDQDSERHGIECDMIILLPGIAGAHSVDYGLLRLIVRYLSNRIYKASLVPSQDIYLPTLDAFACTKDLVGHKSSASPDWLKCVEEAALDMYGSDPNGNLQANAEELVTIACQINANCFALYDPAASTLAEIGASLLPLSGMLNHSCSPNCIPITDSLGQSVITTVKDVAAGVELTISYVDLYLPNTDRREKLLGTKSFWCQCARCLDPVSDFSIDGVRCTRCQDGYFMPPLLDEGFESKSDTIYRCSLCSTSLSKTNFDEVQRKSSQDFEAALDFAKIRNFEAAKRSLEAFRMRSKETLHPNHHHLFNSLPPLINACIKVQEFGLAIQYAKETIALMDSASFVPSNWPEKADYWFRLGELLEIYGMALKEGLVSNKEDNKMKEWRDYLKESLGAYQTCSRIRTVAFGRDHPITRLAREQEIGLGLACIQTSE